MKQNLVPKVITFMLVIAPYLLLVAPVVNIFPLAPSNTGDGTTVSVPDLVSMTLHLYVLMYLILIHYVCVDGIIA